MGKHKYSKGFGFLYIPHYSILREIETHAICFLWCHVRHINLSNKHRERIKKNDKQIAEELNYDGIEFPIQEKDFNKIEIKNNICINVFGYENKIVFPIYISDKKFEDSNFEDWICYF